MSPLTRLGSIGALALVLASSASAHSHADSHALHERAATVAITGAPNGGIQPRLECNQMMQNADQWNLFVLAMNAFQNTDHSDNLGWYTIAGIHGNPTVEWDGVAGYDNNPDIGYCPHTNPLFPAWHRVYTALWEQQMIANAQNVVNQFSGADKARYQTALETLRFCYWDWAMVPPSGNAQDAAPSFMTNSSVTVNTPTGIKTIDNPFYAYNNMNPHPQSDFAGFSGDWDVWGDTLRYPSNMNDANAVSEETQFVSAIANYNPTARSQLYQMLVSCDTYLDVSNDQASSSSPNCANSLESIHNSIHAYTGGSGHMAYNNFAAFDPAFFLHHAMVDRAFALWQALHPNSWMPSTNSGGGATYSMAANTPVDANTGLAPFHSDTIGTLWTVNGIRDVETFKYTYPELQSGNVAEAVNALYGSNAAPQKLSSVSSSPSATPSASSSAGSSSASATKGASSSASSTAADVKTSAGASSSGASSASKSGSASASKSDSASASGSGSASGSASASGSGSASAGKSGSITATVPGSQATGGLPGLGGLGGMASSIASEVKSGLAGMMPSGVASAIESGVAGMMPSGVASEIQSGLAGIMPTVSGGRPAFPTMGSVPFSNSTSGGSNGLTPTTQTHSYGCNVVSEKHGLGGTYTIYGFLGDAPSSSNPSDWISSPNFCGSHSVFAPLNKAPQTGMLVTGNIPLTAALAAKVASGALKSLEETDVLPYLTKNLNWKTATAAKQPVDNSQVPGLTVAAVNAKVMPAANNGVLPTYSNFTTQPQVTHGKPGGLQQGMQYDWWNVCGATAQKL